MVCNSIHCSNVKYYDVTAKYTYIRHGQGLVEANLHFVNDSYTERKHSHKHGNLKKQAVLNRKHLMEG